MAGGPSITAPGMDSGINGAGPGGGPGASLVPVLVVPLVLAPTGAVLAARAALAVRVVLVLVDWYD